MTRLKKRNSKNLLVIFSRLHGLSNDTTHNSDEYIDRPKLTEQKNPFEYIVPPPLKWNGTKN